MAQYNILRTIDYNNKKGKREKAQPHYGSPNAINDPMFSTFQHPSKEFLKFAALYLADGKSDPNNKPTFASCLVRIPGAFNAKCLEAGRGLEESKVNIVQKWNGIRPKMPLEMLTDFKGYLVSFKIQKLEEEQKQQRHYHSSRHRHYANHKYKTTVPWIEKLLQTPLRDHRKSTIREVIAPYLITTRGLDYNQSFEIIKEWLYNKCDKVESLNPRDFDHVIKEALNWSINQNWRPISLDKLKLEKPELYNTIMI